MEKMYIRKGSYIVSRTGYVGEIESENNDFVIVKYFHNPRSGVGYVGVKIPKNMIEEWGK